jgi:hypothetical protein
MNWDRYKSIQIRPTWTVHVCIGMLGSNANLTNNASIELMQKWCSVLLLDRVVHASLNWIDVWYKYIYIGMMALTIKCAYYIVHDALAGAHQALVVTPWLYTPIHFLVYWPKQGSSMQKHPCMQFISCYNICSQGPVW